MDANNYVIQYPIDAVHPDKFAELLGKPRTAVVEMIKANKLPVVEFRDPNKPNARAGDNPKLDRVENYESMNIDYVVEDYAAGCLVEKIKVGDFSTPAKATAEPGA
ncbi:hypothetical protein CDA79_003930 [Escherichia coli]|nr:hypothetical protein [Escherichia coli]